MKFIIHLTKDLKFVECSQTIQRYLIKFGTKVCYSNFGGMGFLVVKLLLVLQNFLASRKQRVVLNNQQSSQKDKTVGASQESMFELLLFLTSFFFWQLSSCWYCKISWHHENREWFLTTNSRLRKMKLQVFPKFQCWNFFFF